MRYIIIGAGAVGGVIASRLDMSGREVVLVARGENAAALRSHGLRLVSPEGTTVFTPAVAERPEDVALEPGDVLILATKSQDTISALDQWAGRRVSDGQQASDALPVVCAQNGVANERAAARRFQHVYGMSVWFPASHLEPGVVVAGAPDRIEVAPVGRYPTGADSTIREIARDLEKGGFHAPVEDDIMYWKYAKLLNNLGNALEAVAGPITEPEAVEIYEAAKAEGSAVLAAAGIRYASPQEQADLLAEQSHLLRAENPLRIGGSSWQSLSRGTGSIEADYLNGEIVMLGRDYGIPTPVNRLLQREANMLAREVRPPGDVAVDDLVKRLNIQGSNIRPAAVDACHACPA